MKKYISEKEVSAMTGRGLQTLRDDRYKGKGFPYIKYGKAIKYDQDEVIAIMEAHKIKTTGF